MIDNNETQNATVRGNGIALLIIDPVNDFLSPDGAAWELTKSTVEMNKVVPNLRRLMEGARKRNIPVLIGPMAYTREDYADAQWQLRSGINRIMFERKMFLAGSWGADFHPDLTPQAGDVVLQPHKGMDVFETDLPEHLERLGVKHLVIAGMTANLCCESTGRHATEHGYNVTFLSDAVGAENVPAYEASIRINYPLIANAVMKVDDFLNGLDSGTFGSVEVRAGDTVYGSDHGEIGKVERVVAASAGDAAHFVVPRGIIIDRDLYIPLDAVVNRIEDSVFINVPKLVVGKMEWSEAPRVENQNSKEGPAAARVDRLYGSVDPTAGRRSEGAEERR